MRLINVDTLELDEFIGSDIPPYAILSHRWTNDEIDFKDFRKGRRHDSTGWQKISQFCSLIKSISSTTWAWVDTVCIDKRSSAELSEAINSMYQYYQQARVCFVYLADVWDISEEPMSDRAEAMEITVDATKATPSMSAIKSSEWLTRGWTLQELLAPDHVVFLSNLWRPIGDIRKQWMNADAMMCLGEFPSAARTVSDATEIDCGVLLGTRPLSHVSIAEKMSWFSRRRTTRIEDMAYCALGIFGVHMPLLYGEGTQAFHRLQAEIIAYSNDTSIFTWENHDIKTSPILAGSFADFEQSRDIWYRNSVSHCSSWQLTNRGLEIRLEKDSALRVANNAEQEYRGLMIIPLNCLLMDNPEHAYLLALQPANCGHYDRLHMGQHSLLKIAQSASRIHKGGATIIVHSPGRGSCTSGTIQFSHDDWHLDNECIKGKKRNCAVQ